MHSLEEILAETRTSSNLCQAVERDGAICFNKRRQGYRFCTKHLYRWSKYKSFDLPKKEIKKCKFINCKEKHLAKMYCKKHYAKYVVIPKNEQKKCKAENCNKNRSNKHRYCGKHVKRIRVYGNLEGSGKKRGCAGRFNLKLGNRKILWEKCIVPNCEIKNGEPFRFSKGLCSKHYQRWRTYGDYNIASKKQYLQQQGALK